MTPNSYDDTILRRIVIEELSEREARRLALFIKDVRKRLIRRFDNLQDRSGLKSRTVKSMIEQANQIHNQLYERMHNEYRDNAREFAKDQADWRKANLATATGNAVGLTTRQAVAAMSFNPALGRNPSEWYSELKDNHKRRVRSAIRQSFAEGGSVSSAVQRLKDTLDHNARGLRTFVRTSYSNIAANVDLATYKGNNIGRYIWLSTLDSRTTKICMSRDGNEYKVGQGPMPPAHFNCRSTTYAVTPETKGIRDETYNEWLRRQPASVQDGIMGKSRAQKYRDNPSFTIQKFISRNGGWKKLDDIKAPKPRPKRAKATKQADDFDNLVWSSEKVLNDVAIKEWASAPKWARDLLKRLNTTEMTIVKKGAWYTGSTGRVSLSLGSTGAIRHEFGHAIDHMLGGPGSLGKGNQYASFGKERRAGLKADRKAIYAAERDPLAEIPQHEKIAGAFGITGPAPKYNTGYFYNLLRQTVAKYPGNDLKRQEAINLADLMGAISDNRVGFGHPNAYYKKWKREAGFSSGNTTEAFANWFHFMTGDKASVWDEIFSELIPGTHAAFKEIVGI